MRLVWATCGRSWGFRFLLDGGHHDPLPVYDRAFAGTEEAEVLCRHVEGLLALRFPDPLGRCDEAGRVIPHDIVVQSSRGDDIHSAVDGQRRVWPWLADAFALVWEQPRPPSPADVREALGGAPPGWWTGGDLRSG